MKALVTGAAGFIGSRVCQELAARDFAVRALALPVENTSAVEKWASEIHRGDITKPESLHGVSVGVDLVIHLAARVAEWGPRKAFYDTILEGTRNLLMESQGNVKRFVHVSSIAALGLGRHLKGLTEDDPPQKSGVPYNDAKLEAEALVRSFSDTSGMTTVIVRPANVIGPGSVWVQQVAQRFKSGPVPLMDGGRHSASLVYVSNLADGIILAGTMEHAAGRIYHFRDDYDVTWKKYLTDLSAMVGKKPSFSIPFRLAWNLGAALETVLTPLNIRSPITRLAAGVMGRDLDVDTTRARTELGWQTRVSYEQGMDEIRAWVRENIN
jgi:nucleoside-diphosphate-sugar epimerase